MNVQELLVATQAHLARSDERVQSVVLPASDHATEAEEELRQARIDLEHVHAYASAARVTADELTSGLSETARGVGRVGDVDVDLLGRQCVMVEEMTARAARRLRQARRGVGEDATAAFATGIDVAQGALADVISAVRSAARMVHELARESGRQTDAPAVRRMHAVQREQFDRPAVTLVGPQR